MEDGVEREEESRKEKPRQWEPRQGEPRQGEPLDPILELDPDLHKHEVVFFYLTFEKKRKTVFYQMKIYQRRSFDQTRKTKFETVSPFEFKVET